MRQVRRGNRRAGVGCLAGPVGKVARRHAAARDRHGRGTVLALRAFGTAVLALGLLIPWGPIAEADPSAGSPTVRGAREAADVAEAARQVGVEVSGPAGARWTGPVGP